MTRITGHAYPWDVLGDELFAHRVAGYGITDVTLACAYHGVRASTPMHPGHQIVTAPTSALYREIRPDAWAGRRLVPAPATWLDVPDPFTVASDMLTAAGIDVTAWIVLTHNTRLGEAHPDVAVVNCFGDSYSHALCPRWLEVREYAATLAVEAVRDTNITGILLEAWAQQGIAHGSLHDKTAGAWSSAAMRLLSVCCCAACRLAWHDRGLDPSSVAASLRDAVRYDRDLPEDILAQLLAVRLEAAAILLADVVDAVTGTHPTRPVSVFGDPDPWATMPIAAVGRHASTVVVPAWSTDPARADAVAVARKTLPPSVSVGAYVTVLPPVELADVPLHVEGLLTAGAEQLNLYHLGLAGPDRQRALAEACRSGEATRKEYEQALREA